MSDFEYSLNASFSSSDEGESSGNTDSEGGEIFDKDMKEMSSRMKIFNHYMYKPSTCSDASDVSDFD